MRTQRRWMKWVFEEADNLDVVLPWERKAQRTLWRRHLNFGKVRGLLSRA